MPALSTSSCLGGAVCCPSLPLDGDDIILLTSTSQSWLGSHRTSLDSILLHLSFRLVMPMVLHFFIVSEIIAGDVRVASLVGAISDKVHGPKVQSSSTSLGIRYLC